MKQSVAEKQAHVDKLNKIGPELAKLSPGAGARLVEGKLADDNKRYNDVKDDVNKRGDKLFDRLQRTASVSFSMGFHCHIFVHHMYELCDWGMGRSLYVLLDGARQSQVDFLTFENIGVVLTCHNTLHINVNVTRFHISKSCSKHLKNNCICEKKNENLLTWKILQGIKFILLISSTVYWRSWFHLGESQHHRRKASPSRSHLLWPRGAEETDQETTGEIALKI